MIIQSIAKLDSAEEVLINKSTVKIDFLANLFRLMVKGSGKSFTITDDCTNCGKCEKSYPNHNISLKDKSFGKNCMLCTRCIHSCPVNAITFKGKSVDQYRVGYTLNI